jgi:hypothetical protein
MTDEQTMAVRYIAAVESPEDKAGQVGDERELPKAKAEWLIAAGYCEAVGGTATEEPAAAAPAE